MYILNNKTNMDWKQNISNGSDIPHWITLCPLFDDLKKKKEI